MTPTHGRHTYFGGPLTVHEYFGAGEPWHDITFGNYCSIGADVELLPGGMHDLDRVTTFPMGRVLPGVEVAARLRGPIRVGHDVWIGRGARILGGATIGNGAVIGAYAVVAGDVPHYHVAIGNPARCTPRPIHRYADQMERIAWWDWIDADQRLDDVHHLAPADFVAKYAP